MFTGNENHFISLADAVKLTKKYRTTFGHIFGDVKGEFFGKMAIQELLDISNSVGIRVYFGMSDDIVPLPKLVIVAVDANGNDILVNEKIVEDGMLCPPLCSIANSLNS